MASIYLDHAATTALDPEVRAAMEPWLGDTPANPSSLHRAGVAAREALDRARARVARAAGASPERVVFTSGGTEADNLAVLGPARARARRGRHVVLGPTEHAAVRGAAEALRAEGFELETARLDAGGALDLEHLAALLRADTVLVAQMLVGNELGNVFPVAAVARLVRARAPQAVLVVDAVQALGKLELSLAALGADALTLSAHKVHGPKGAGALVTARELSLRALIHGGGQESGLRAGTENVAAIVGFGRAAELAEERREPARAHLEELRRAFVAGLGRLPSARVLAIGPERVPGIVPVLFRGVPAEVRLHHLDARGLAVSAGSACQARKGGISPALSAAGLDDDQARRVLRFSFAGTTTLDEIGAALRVLEAVERELEAPRP